MIQRRDVNVANTLSVARFVLLPILYVLLDAEAKWEFLVAYVIIGSTDFFDGLLARRLNQQSEIGKTLDSLADLFFYFSSAYFLWHLFRPVIEANMLYLSILFVLIGLSFLISWVKLGKPVMMHTRILRLGGVLVYTLVILSFFLDTTRFTLFTIFVYAFGFIEEILIFLLYGQVDRDTQSIWHAHSSKEDLK